MTVATMGAEATSRIWQFSLRDDGYVGIWRGTQLSVEAALDHVFTHIHMRRGV